jgi:hypothetical protein
MNRFALRKACYMYICFMLLDIRVYQSLLDEVASRVQTFARISAMV